ncbi:BREX system Lon protease-like protein BrxL [Methanomethylophilus alvi]|uniref:BREX system Lon protease-like protein BrxL n=1 Tax=Methanomethylophilus alvi TaxID=1291540 RepID=UPI0037DD6FFB
MTEKIREIFDDKVVYKDLKKNSFFKSIKLPSFLRDWVLRKFEDEEGMFDIAEISDFIATYMPRPEDWLSIKNRLVKEYETVKILTRVEVDINIRTEEVTFSLPVFDVSNKETIIEPHIWEQYKGDLISSSDVWGVIELGYRPPNEDVRPRIPGKIKMLSFTSFRPYDIDLNYYKEARNEFSIEEWISILMGAMDLNADGCTPEQRLTILSRLLPFVEKNLNILELAPKGTGKSVTFGTLSKYGVLIDGGKVTRAKMFYDSARKNTGYIVGHDYVAIDEVKLVQFNDVNEMRQILQGYMEKGSCDVNGNQIISDAGVVFLGNISDEKMDIYDDMLSELPSLFKESALVDRLHGFIKGWDIPFIKQDIKVSGWALNTEYFCSILHELRYDISYRAIVDQIVDYSGDSYERHVEAVKRLATAYLKLLFPNVRDENDPTLKKYFMRYCLRPAIEMRKAIYKQLSILDVEYKKENKQMPTFSVRFSDEEL